MPSPSASNPLLEAVSRALETERTRLHRAFIDELVEIARSLCPDPRNCTAGVYDTRVRFYNAMVEEFKVAVQRIGIPTQELTSQLPPPPPSRT